MATSSIKKNFVVSGKKQVEMFANAIGASYQESFQRPQSKNTFKYQKFNTIDELNNFMEKWEKSHAR